MKFAVILFLILTSCTLSKADKCAKLSRDLDTARGNRSGEMHNICQKNGDTEECWWNVVQDHRRRANLDVQKLQDAGCL